MIGTFIVAMVALIIAVVGCAWLRPSSVRSTDQVSEREI